MWTYQVRQRQFKLEEGQTLNFPNDVEILFIFSPTQPFGAGLDHGRTAVQNFAARVVFNGNSGKHWIEPQQPLEQLEVKIHEDEVRTAELNGNILKISTHCVSIAELHTLIESLYFLLPVLLNVEFADPPIIERVSGTVGEVIFGWELSGWRLFYEITTKDRQEERFVTSWQRFNLISPPENRRLVAALHYFHLACRLEIVGNAPWEFMGEIILNLSKVLESLFPGPEGRTMEAVREGLSTLGLSSQDIERYFIPAIALRNNIDSGHVLLSVFTRNQLEALHTYTTSSLESFRHLLRLIFDKMNTSEYSVIPYTDPTPREGAITTISRIEQNLIEAHSSERPYQYYYRI